jgi:hypothetical protein
MILWLTALSCLLAVFPAVLFVRNLRVYAPLPPAGSSRPACSVLIPARNEANNIERAVRSVLQSEMIELEVIVLDDASEDGTGDIVREIAAEDTRVRVETAPPLPDGWCGKNFACQQLARLAHHPVLVFLDADVRVARADTLARLVRFVEKSGASLVSGVPRQEVGTFLEKLLIPLIHFVLLGFLPLRRMRASTKPSYAAACGQVVAVRRDAYEKTGGHGAIAGRIHDAVALTRSFRSAGLTTDLFDATDTFVCRMYRSAREVWHGLGKNAHEGLAAPHLIGLVTLLLLGGQVLPLFLLMFAPSPLALLAVAAIFSPRVLAIARFRQPPLGALLHPFAICALLAIQWAAFFRSLRLRPAVWKGRAYPSQRPHNPLSAVRGHLVFPRGSNALSAGQT